MHTSRAALKFSTVVCLVVLITVLHYGTLHGELGHHIAHRELYFIPIILSGYWFGMSIGLATSVIISLVYAPHVYSYQDGNWMPVLFQILMFNLVAFILGVLVERGKRQQARMLMVERSAALDLAATAVSHEMNDLLDALKSISSQMVRTELTEINRGFQYEIGRLEEMVDIISTFSSKEPLHLFSHDLNEIIQERVRHSVNAANKADVRLVMALDKRGCPCRVDFESLGRAVDRIIQNALEASVKGQSVYIRSQRKKDHCEIEITDQGHGIQPEHLLKVFKPFFTTKDKRDGLSLSVSQKVVQNMGGKIAVQSDYGHGATFLITIPLAKSEKFLKK